MHTIIMYVFYVVIGTILAAMVCTDVIIICSSIAKGDLTNTSIILIANLLIAVWLAWLYDKGYDSGVKEAIVEYYKRQGLSEEEITVLFSHLKYDAIKDSVYSEICSTHSKHFGKW